PSGDGVSEVWRLCALLCRAAASFNNMLWSFLNRFLSLDKNNYFNYVMFLVIINIHKLLFTQEKLSPVKTIAYTPYI
ncbi:hypothetical protein, partial [Vibrio thalassae]|uniref:hypothetical protein n=1 Tax=Vibrio thalassae TaxID=1243014 RepID=UPI00364341A9